MTAISPSTTPTAEHPIPDTMTLEELAARLGISLTVAYERAHADDLPVPVIRIGRRFLFSRIAYERLMAGPRADEARQR